MINDIRNEIGRRPGLRPWYEAETEDGETALAVGQPLGKKLRVEPQIPNVQ